MQERRISYKARIDLVVFDKGSVTTQQYVNEVLQNHVISFAIFLGENFRFDIQVLPWPARSPDVNPIEHN